MMAAPFDPIVSFFSTADSPQSELETETVHLNGAEPNPVAYVSPSADEAWLDRQHVKRGIKPLKRTTKTETNERRSAPVAPIIILPTNAKDLPPNLPPEFWNARENFRIIRQAAHNRLIGADSVFMSCLARIAGGVPHELKIPALVGAVSPLNVLVNLIGPSNEGKSTSYRLSREIVELDSSIVVDDIPVGSGEGLAEALFDWVDTTDENGKRIKVKQQVYFNAVAYVDEGEVMNALQARSGSILIPTLRQIWSGAELGQMNASRERRRPIQAGHFSYGVVVSLQTELAGSLLEGAIAGTPQRFLYASVFDPSTPDIKPEWPLGLPLTVLDELGRLRGTEHPLHMGVAQSIRMEVEEAARNARRGKNPNADPMSAHHNLMRLKVAGNLAVLDNRVDMSEEDWQLATIVKDTSDAVRSHVQRAVMEVEAREETKYRTKLAGRAEVTTTAAEKTRESLKVTSLATVLTRKVTAKPGITARTLKATLSDGQRGDFDPALAHAIEQGWIVEREEETERSERGAVAKRALYPLEVKSS